MVEYGKINVKLTNTQLKKLKTAVENKTKTAQWNNLPHELLLTTRPKTKLRNAFEKNM